MASPSHSTSAEGGSTFGPLQTWNDVERLWREGSEGAALDLAAELLPDRLNREDFAKARHDWPLRLESIHPAALDDARRVRWEKVAGFLIRRPSPPSFRDSLAPGTVDFPVLGVGGLSDRIVRVHVDRLDGEERSDRLPDARQATESALRAVETALRAVRQLLPAPMSFSVNLLGVSAPIDDESLGLPIAMAAYSAARRCAVPERFCLTGKITEDGEVKPVKGIDRKKRLVALERPLAELLGPADHLTLLSAIARVFEPDLARGRKEYRTLAREAFGHADRARFAVAGLSVGTSRELSAVYVDPDLLPDDHDREWRQHERELARAIENCELSEAEREPRKREYRAWTGREFCHGEAGAAQRLPWQPAIQAHRAVVICGDPGMGKTTILARIMLAALGESDDDAEGTPGPLPVLISAADVQASDVSLVACALRSARTRWPDAPLWALLALTVALDEGRVVLLVDGLNEASEAERPRLLQLVWSWRETRSFPLCRFTTRRWALDKVTLPSGVRVFHLAGLSENQAYDLLARSGAGGSAGAWKTLSFIRRRPALREIAANPLLLLLSASLSESEIEALQHWADIYKGAVRILLPSPRADLLEAEFVADHLRAWSFVAQDMQERSSLTIREHDARNIIGAASRSSRALQGSSVTDLLATALNRGGLVVRRGEGDLAFWHPSFQEYLAAVRWTDDVDPDAGDALAQLRDFIGPLVARRENHVALRLALGRLAFHLGRGHTALATALLKSIAGEQDADPILDGAWLLLATDAVLDGVPVPRVFREKLATRLATRIRTFDDFATADRFAMLAGQLLGDTAAPSLVTLQSLAELVEAHMRAPMAVLESATRLLAAAAGASDVARDACRGIYDRTRPPAETSQSGYGWASVLMRLAAVGLLRAGIIPEGRAVRILAPKHAFGEQYFGDVVRAVQANPVAAAEALRPYLAHSDEEVRQSALRLAAVAGPDGSDADAYIRWCFEQNELSGPWLQAMCSSSGSARARLFAMAAGRGSDSVMAVMPRLCGAGAEMREVLDPFVAWLLSQPFTEPLAHSLPRTWYFGGDRVQEFLGILGEALGDLAASSDPRAPRADGWLALLARPPSDEAVSDAQLQRLRQFAATTATSGAGEWFAPLLRVGGFAAASDLAIRLLRDGDEPDVLGAVDVIRRRDRTLWPATVREAAADRALHAARAGQGQITMKCALLFERRHAPAAVNEGLRLLLAGDNVEVAWEAAVRLVEFVGFERELAIKILRRLGGISRGTARELLPDLFEWVERQEADDEPVLSALFAGYLDESEGAEYYLRPAVTRAVSKRPDNVKYVVGELIGPDPARCARAWRRLSSIYYVGKDQAEGVALHRAIEQWLDDPVFGLEVLRALVDSGVPSDASRLKLRALAERDDEDGEWAAAALAAWHESTPQHRRGLVRRLVSDDYDEVLLAVNDLWEDPSQSPAVVNALRRCLAGSPVQALQAALMLYGMEEDIAEAVPRLLDGLRVHEKVSVLRSELFLVAARRRQHALHPSRGSSGIKMTNAATGEVISDERYPEPKGRERFRPVFPFHSTIAETAACLLVEMEQRQVIPTLIGWLRGEAGPGARTALEMIQFLGAQSEPEVVDWLLRRVGASNFSEAEAASTVLLESNLAPRRHVETLIEQFRGKNWGEPCRTGDRIIFLCATSVEAAAAAEAALEKLEPKFVWMIARWLIGTGRCTSRVAAAYLDAELSLSLSPFERYDYVTERGDREEGRGAARSMFDEERLSKDALVQQGRLRGLGAGTPEQRVKKVENLLYWRRGSGGEAGTLAALMTDGPLRDGAIGALRSALRSDDAYARSVAVEHLALLGAVDEQVLSAALVCLEEQFGEGTERPFGGDGVVSKEAWEDLADRGRVRAARVLLKHGRRAEALAGLDQAIQRIPPVGYGNDGWIEIVELLRDEDVDRTRLVEPLKRWIGARGTGSPYFERVAPLLEPAGVEDPFIRAAVLDAFAAGEQRGMSITIAGWASGGPSYRARSQENPESLAASRSIPDWAPPTSTTADWLRAQLEWLSEQAIPDSILLPAMLLLASNYDQGGAEELERLLALSRVEATAQERLARLSMVEADELAGPRFAKAWLFLRLTN